MSTLTVKTTDGAVTKVDVPDDYEVDAHTSDGHLHWPGGGAAHLTDVEDATVSKAAPAAKPAVKAEKAKVKK